MNRLLFVPSRFHEFWFSDERLAVVEKMYGLL